MKQPFKCVIENRSALLALLLISPIMGCFGVPAHASNASGTGSGTLGVCTHSLTKEEAGLVRLGGLEWIRADVAEIPGEYSFAEVAANAKERGIRVLGILDIWTLKWKWDFGLAEWENAVKSSVIRYRDVVEAWEIWNEPEYPSNPLAPERYQAMLRVSYSIIKEYDPDAKVIMGGGLHLNTGGDPWLARDKAFAKRLFELGAQQYADGISFHAYPWTREVTDWVWNKYDESLRFYESLTEKKLDLWITETGHPAQFDGEDSQAKYLTKASSFFRERGAEVVFWYELRDIPKWTTESPTFGLFTEALKARSAFFALPTKFIGVNYVSATQLYDTPTDLVSRDFVRFRSDGINTVVLVIYWYRVEIARGVYDERFIDNVVRVAGLAATYDIRVMIDFHTSATGDEAQTNPEYVGAGRSLITRPEIASAYLTMIRWTVDRVRDLPNLWCYSVLNEPRYLPLGEPERRNWTNLVVNASNAVKTLDDRPVTVSLAESFFDHDWTWNPRLLNAIDLISLDANIDASSNKSDHLMTFDEYQTRLANMTENATRVKKQVVVTEFGYDTTNSTLQAEEYQRYIDMFESTPNLTGWISWNWITGYDPTIPASELDQYSLADPVTGAPRPAYYVLCKTAA